MNLFESVNKNLVNSKKRLKRPIRESEKANVVCPFCGEHLSEIGCKVQALQLFDIASGKYGPVGDVESDLGYYCPKCGDDLPEEFSDIVYKASEGKLTESEWTEKDMSARQLGTPVYILDNIRDAIADYNNAGGDLTFSFESYDDDTNTLKVSVYALGQGEDEEFERTVEIKLPGVSLDVIKGALEEWGSAHNSPDSFYEGCTKKKAKKNLKEASGKIDKNSLSDLQKAIFDEVEWFIDEYEPQEEWSGLIPLDQFSEQDKLNIVNQVLNDNEFNTVMNEVIHDYLAHYQKANTPFEESTKKLKEFDANFPNSMDIVRKYVREDSVGTNYGSILIDDFTDGNITYDLRVYPDNKGGIRQVLFEPYSLVKSGNSNKWEALDNLEDWTSKFNLDWSDDEVTREAKKYLGISK